MHMKNIYDAECFGAEDMDGRVVNVVGGGDKVYVTIRFPDTNEHYGYDKIFIGEMEDVMLAESFGAESKFDKLAKEIAEEYEEKGKSPKEAMEIGEATAAKIGRAKFGKRKFAKMGQKAESFGADEELEYPCDVCGKPSDYNFQDGTLRWKIKDDEFVVGKPKISVNGDQNDFYCKEHADLNETGIFYAESFEAQSTKRPKRNTSLKGADLSGYDLTGANLSNANLTGANLRWVDLSGADLFWADLTGANLISTNLSGANLSNTNLNDANLYYANLSNAKLRYANLSYANLTDANLSNAYLYDADMRNANMTGVKKAEDLSSFTSKELTESSAIHGDFDHASINYSGHQNLVVLDAEENIALVDPSFWMNYPITSMLATAGIFAI